MLQTILGANGSIAVELSKALPQYQTSIRQVSRNPKKVNDTDEIMAADLTDAAQTEQAVAGSDIAYLTVGLPYDHKVWQEQWPKIMDNAIAACQKHQTKLVFFDNVYMYGKVNGWMTEETPHHPISKKGRVRAQIADKLMNEVEKGTLQALVARAADFYGKSPVSLPGVLVFENFNKGKKAQWLCKDECRHSYTYIPDAGKATALLGNTEDAYGEVWHLPTDGQPLTGKQFIAEVAMAFEVEAKYTLLNKWMLQLVGLFNKSIRESIEMLYQNQYDYLFESSKFEKRFPDFSTHSYLEGIMETKKAYRKAMLTGQTH